MSVVNNNTTSGAIITVVATAVPDILSQQNQQPLTVLIDEDNNTTSGVIVTAVATPLPDIESQHNQHPPTGAVAGNCWEPHFDGQGQGITMVALLTIANIIQFLPWTRESDSYVFFPIPSFVPYVYLVCTIATIVISSGLTCGCCCARGIILNLMKVKFANATLVSLLLIFAIQFLHLFGFGDVHVIVVILSFVLNGMALIFACLFTWGCGEYNNPCPGDDAQRS